MEVMPIIRDIAVIICAKIILFSAGSLFLGQGCNKMMPNMIVLHRTCKEIGRFDQ